ncbi:MAG: DUF5926 family protein [Nocardioidaceae bacterium]
MAKRRRNTTAIEGDPGQVGPRASCPCGSGRRYKACHGRADGVAPFVARSFKGLPGEADWVAMREIVPAATASVRLRAGVAESAGPQPEVLVCTLLPLAYPGLVRADGAVWLGLQVQHGFGDPSRDLAWVLTRGLDSEPGTELALVDDPGPGPRMQDLVDPAPAFEVHVHEGFDFWVADVDDPDGSVAASLQAANEAAAPSVRLAGVDAAYWTRLNGKEFLRWVMPHDEDDLLDALARLHVAGDDTVGESSRLIGSFRAHGLLAPVWELSEGGGAGPLEEPAAAFAGRLGDALTETAPLTAQQRSARSGLASRQLTIR